MRSLSRPLGLLLAAGIVACAAGTLWLAKRTGKNDAEHPVAARKPNAALENYTTLPGPYPKIKPSDRRFSRMGSGVCLSFDDRAIDEWFSLRDLLERYGARVTFAVGNPLELREDEWEKLAALREAGHEIACHGFNHVDFGPYMGQKLRRGDSLVSIIDAYLTEEVFPALNAMRRRGFSPESFVYPHGGRCGELDIALLSHFRVVRAITGREEDGDLRGLEKAFFTWSGRTEWPVYGASLDAGARRSDEDLLQALEKAGNEGSVLVLYGHSPMLDAKEGDFVFSVRTLEKILSYTKEHDGFDFYRLSDLAPLGAEGKD